MMLINSVNPLIQQGLPSNARRHLQRSGGQNTFPVGHEIQLCNASGQNLHLCPARDMWATCTLHSKGTCDPNAQGTATLLGGNKAKSTDSLAESGCSSFKLFLHQGTLILTVPTLLAQRICSGFTRRGTWHS